MINQFKNEYRWLSNFYDCEVVYRGVTYPSVENAYQASKSLDPQVRLTFVNVSASESKKMGKKIKKRADFDIVKYNIMFNLLIQKFNKQPFKQLLLDTKNQKIVEGNYWNDKTWGVCLKTNTGNNALGKMIMQIRDNINV